MIIIVPLAPSIRGYKGPSIQRVQLEKVGRRRVPVRVVQIGAEHGGPGGDEEKTP